jgi:hypothetical protein
MSYHQKQFTAFLSFADPDRPLVKAIHDLFWEMREPTYFAPVELPATGSTGWREKILEGIRNSYSFVPIYTRHSINRKWVLYESGVADCIGLPRFPAKDASTAVSDIEDLPSPSALVYDLSIEESLTQLLINVCHSKGGDRSKIKASVHALVNRSSHVRAILNLSRVRWVFVAGNTPLREPSLRTNLSWYTNRAEYISRLKNFTVALTTSLLENGFSIAACPQVNSLGLQVINTAADLLVSKTYSDPVDYKIGGIYPIDRKARKIKLSETAKKQWVSHIMSFRRSYLDDQEWLVVIGGNQGTSDEYAAAKECGVRVHAIPCFGGSALTIWRNEELDPDSPCVICDSKDGLCGEEGAGRIARFLKNKYL